MKTIEKARHVYIEALLRNEPSVQIYAKTYHDAAGSFDELEVLAAAQAIALYREENHIGDNYKVTVAIDALSKSLAKRIGRSFRLLGIKIRNVHGERDEASTLIRLADAVAGLVRGAHEGRDLYKTLKKQLKDKKRLYEL